MSSLSEGLSKRLCNALGWAPGAAPEVGRAGRRALLMATGWTVLIFAAVYGSSLSQQGFDPALTLFHVLAAASGGFLVLLVIGIVLMNILMLLPASWLLPTRKSRKWIVAVGLAVFVTGVTHVSMWVMPEVSVRGSIPLSVMLPHLIGGLIGWGLVQELIEIGGEA